MLATAVPQMLADNFLDERGSFQVAMLLGLIQIYVTLLVTFRTLHHAGAAPPGYVRADLTEARYGSAFVMSLLSSLGIILGLVLLIVPGILLALLWSLAMPVIAAERARGTQALHRSWSLARTALGRLGLILLPYLAAFALLIVAMFAVEDVRPDLLFAGNIVLNLAISALFTLLPSVWTFAYLALREPSADSRSATI